MKYIYDFCRFCLIHKISKYYKILFFKNLNGYSGTIVNDSGQVIRSLDIGSGEIEQLIDLNGFTSGAYFIILNDKSNQLQLMARFIKI